MPTGRVRWFDAAKGYGFITSEEAHHGFICATGTDGGGLTFTVVLPIEQIAAPEPKQSTGKTKDAKQKTSWFSSERKTQATQPKA